MTTIKCLVVDDEELARILITSYIEKLDFLELVGSAEDAFEAMQIMKKQQIDLIFLDIQMPKLKGTVFAKTVDKTTKIIFTTAYSEFALEGFELNALDYLLKPITFERFLTAVHKFKSISLKQLADTMTIKSGYELHKVKFTNIRYIESDSEYVIYYVNDKKIMSNQSLKSLEKILPKSLFLRVHRSYIINKQFVTGLKGRYLILSEEVIPVSDSYFETVKLNVF